MSPPTRRGGPPPKQETARTPLPSTASYIISEDGRQRYYPDLESMAPGGCEVVPRAGELVRVTTGRTVDAYCPTCGRRPTTAGSAASHARKSRHTVFVDYRARFSFEAAPRPDAGWIE